MGGIAHAVPAGGSPGALPGAGCITLALAGSARVIPMLFGTLC